MSILGGINHAIEDAQRAGEKLLKEANEKQQKILKDAQNQASKILADVNNRQQAILKDAQNRAESIIKDAKDKAQTLIAEAINSAKQVADKIALEAEIALEKKKRDIVSNIYDKAIELLNNSGKWYFKIAAKILEMLKDKVMQEVTK